MACDGDWSENETCLHFLLSVEVGMFVLTKSCISSTREFIVFICYINLEIAPRIGSADDAVGRGA